jgi:hypothetical protein
MEETIQARCNFCFWYDDYNLTNNGDCPRCGYPCEKMVDDDKETSV